MLYSLGKSLQKENLLSWTDKYKAALLQHRDEKIVHDFLSVLMSGNKLLAKLSSDDNKLLPAIAETLFSIEPGFHKYVQFAEGTMKSFDAVIATGSNNTSRYFDYYFSAYPHIIRKNRNGVAVLTGNETKNDLEGLADDIFFYYGLGCRNVSTIYSFIMVLAAAMCRKSLFRKLMILLLYCVFWKAGQGGFGES